MTPQGQCTTSIAWGVHCQKSSVYNVIVAIFVENTLANARSNDMVRRRNRAQDEDRLSNKFKELIMLMACYKRQFHEEDSEEHADEQQYDENGELLAHVENMVIDKELFEYFLDQDSYVELLVELDINDDDMSDIFDTFDVDGSGSLSLIELLRGIKALRGDPRRSDVVGISLVMQEVHAKIQNIETQLERMTTNPFTDDDAQDLCKPSRCPGFSNGDAFENDRRHVPIALTKVSEGSDEINHPLAPSDMAELR